jgi:mannose-6-phosphate isomerase-like protein (cupin superfamily)
MGSIVNAVDQLHRRCFMPVLPAPSAPTHVLEGARFTSLATPNRGSTDTSVWRVELAPGHPATPHQVTREEVFIVLSGRARVQLGDDVREARVGDAIVVPRDTNFEITVAGEEPLEALCCMPVAGEARLVDGTTFVPPWAK